MSDLKLPSIDESEVAEAVTLADALDEMRAVFRDLANGGARNFPVVRENVGAAVFGVKSGVYARRGLLGLKAGGYFPENAARNETRHQSSILLFDTSSGRPWALVAGNLITKLRTAAAAALSIDLLARQDAAVLAVIGAGAQAKTHVLAALAVRKFEHVLLWNRTPEAARRLADELAEQGVATSVAAGAEDAVRQADVLVTLTTATAPVVLDAWVRAGTHLACMGADTKGKQEVEAGLVARARVFTDSIEQAATIGECQSGLRERRFDAAHIMGTLGEIIDGRAIGRRDPREITLFDGTGLAIQDLAMAGLAAHRRARG